MALYTEASIERVKEATDVVQLIGSRTDLRRVGSRWVGLCPFHEERTPSFSVSPEKGFYHCFGCGASGDVIRFVRESEGLDFREAVEQLAERAGVELELEREDPRAEARRRRRERLHALLDRTAAFYATYLWQSSEARKARAYLVERGFEETVLREFRVGYSPSAWDRLSVGAQRDGFTPEELAAAGLAQRGRGGGLYDRFRGRIMFPLADGRGRVLGFGARSMGEGRGPKYLNTAESELYHKGRQLFGLDLARPHAALAGRVVVVEGYTDVLALHQAGVRETVAIMGTALTDEQLAELARAAPSVYLALDADRAGQEAMLRAARSASDRRVELRVVEMPRGADPAELVAASGADSFLERVAAAQPVLEFELSRMLADADRDTPEGRDRALQEARTVIAKTPKRSERRDNLIRVVADRLNVPVANVVADLRERGASPAARSEQPVGGPISAAALRADRAFLAMCVASGELGREYLRRLRREHLSSETAVRAGEHLERHFDDPLVELPEHDPALCAFVLDVATASADQEPADEPRLRMSFLPLESRRVERELQRAAKDGDRVRQQELAAHRQRVRQEMATVMGQAT